MFEYKFITGGVYTTNDEWNREQQADYWFGGDGLQLIGRYSYLNYTVDIMVNGEMRWTWGNETWRGGYDIPAQYTTDKEINEMLNIGEIEVDNNCWIELFDDNDCGEPWETEIIVGNIEEAIFSAHRYIELTYLTPEN